MPAKWRTYYLIIGLLGIFYSSSSAKDQRVADSLRQIYLRDDLEDTARFEILLDLSFNEVNDFSLALGYAEELIQLAKNQENQRYMSSGYFQKGNKKKILGDLDEALDAYLKSITFAKESGNKKQEGNTYCAIANVYAISDNHDNAMNYYQKAIAILRQTDDSVALASAILNAGNEFLTHQDYDSALMYFKESGMIFERLNHSIGKAYNLGNSGILYANAGDNILAEKNINEAIKILEESEDFYPVCFYLISMSDIYLEKGNVTNALNYASRSLKLAEEYKLKQQISDANLKLSELYEIIGNPGESLKHLRNHIVYRDSVNNLETIQKMADQRTEFEVNLREKEIDLLEKRQIIDRNYIMGAVILLVLSIVLLLLFRERYRMSKLMSVTERRQHEEKIEELLSQHETKALQSMLEGRDNERKRLAQEIHNHIGSLLATIKVNLNGMNNMASGRHQTITSLVDQACNDVRDMSHTLNMGISEDFGLIPALKELTTHLEKSAELEVEFAASMCEIQMNSENEILIYRIVQELVSNVLKHANATKLSVLLTCLKEENLINILVQDNGKGFDHKTVKSRYDGMGINTLKEIATKLKGEIKFDSNAISGTTVIIDLPICSEKKPVLI